MKGVATDKAESGASIANGDQVQAWKHLAPRVGSWRRQYYLNGKNISVGQLVSTVLANNESPEEASENIGLPVEAIREALLYFEQNKDLIAQEATVERQYLQDHGCQVQTRPLP